MVLHFVVASEEEVGRNLYVKYQKEGPKPVP